MGSLPRPAAMILIVPVLGIGSVSTAAESQSQPAVVHQTPIDRLHGATSSLVRSLVGSVDAFFVNDDYETFQENQSRLRVRTDFDWVEHAGWNVQPRVKAYIVLPGLKRRLRLVVNQDDGTDTEEEVASDEDENDVSLRWIGKQTKTTALSFDVGLSLKSGNVDPFLRLNTGIQYGLSEHWFGQTSNRLYYYADAKWRNDLRQYFNRKLADDLLFRSRTRIQYFQENDYNPYLEQKFSVFRTLSPKSAIAYEALWKKQDASDSVYSGSEIDGTPKDAYQEYELRLRYRRNVWREWLYMEFWPSVGWPQERDWETTWGARIRLEVSFGASGDSRLDE